MSIVRVFVYCISCFLLLLVTCFLFLFLISSSPVSFPLRIGLLRFQAGCGKRRLNLDCNLCQLSLFVFDNLYFVGLVVIDLVLC